MHLSNLITRSQENKTTWATFFFFFSKRLFRQKCLSLIIWEDKRLFKTNLKKEAKLEEMLKIETIWPYSKVILYCTRLKISYSFSTISVFLFRYFWTIFELCKNCLFYVFDLFDLIGRSAWHLFEHIKIWLFGQFTRSFLTLFRQQSRKWDAQNCEK